MLTTIPKNPPHEGHPFKTYCEAQSVSLDRTHPHHASWKQQYQAWALHRHTEKKRRYQQIAEYTYPFLLCIGGIAMMILIPLWEHQHWNPYTKLYELWMLSGSVWCAIAIMFHQLQKKYAKLGTFLDNPLPGHGHTLVTLALSQKLVPSDIHTLIELEAYHQEQPTLYAAKIQIAKQAFMMHLMGIMAYTVWYFLNKLPHWSLI